MAISAAKILAVVVVIGFLTLMETRETVKPMEATETGKPAKDDDQEQDGIAAFLKNIDLKEVCRDLAPDPYSKYCSIGSYVVQFVIGGSPVVMITKASSWMARAVNVRLGVGRNCALGLLLASGVAAAVYVTETTDTVTKAIFSMIGVAVCFALPMASLIPCCCGVAGCVNGASLAFVGWSTIGFVVGCISRNAYHTVFDHYAAPKMCFFVLVLAMTTKLFVDFDLWVQASAVAAQGMVCLVYYFILRGPYVRGEFSLPVRCFIFALRQQTRASMGQFFDVFNPSQVKAALRFATLGPPAGGAVAGYGASAGFDCADEDYNSDMEDEFFYDTSCGQCFEEFESRNDLFRHLHGLKGVDSAIRWQNSVPCRFFPKGTCRAAGSCPFSHDVVPVAVATIIASRRVL